MPNHIQNRLQIIGDKKEVKKVFASIADKDEDGKDIQINFNKIIPMPESLRVEAHSGILEWVEICTCQIDFSALAGGALNTKALLDAHNYKPLTNRLKASTAMEAIMGKRKSIKDFTNEELEMFVQCVKNVREHGFMTWYEWNIKNWGTKWNAYEQNDKRNTPDTIFFQTAWSCPIKLIGELSKQNPVVTIKISYADEDSGSNAGIITFKDGEPIEVCQPESQSKEAYELYFELHPDSKENYKLVGDKYEYIDEDN